jgi:hypothetical protein
VRKIGLLLTLAMLVCAAPAAAQSVTSDSAMPSVPGVEISVDYLYVRARSVIPTGCCFNINGGAFSIVANVNRWFGVVGDYGDTYTGNAFSSGATLNVFSYTFGPRISLRKSRRFTPYAQALFGGGHAAGTLYRQYFQVGSNPPEPRNSIAMVLGGGLDINVNRHFAIRAFQADWMYTQFPNGATNNQYYLRMTSGFVFRFGGT